ncbi:MAG: DUF2877 domain-containing protein, partial [Anaerolineae bacterium]|nr:DUF2877 domain-containing protein [Anaerolineae bacterium]
HAIVPRLPAHEALTPWTCHRGELAYGPWRFVMGPGTTVWEPKPDWGALSVTPDSLHYLLSIVLEAVARHRMIIDPHYSVAIDLGVTRLLRAVAAGDGDAIETATRRVAGLGPGLTPYGDDVLAGVILALWAAHHPKCLEIGTCIAGVAASNTNRLSRAFLDAASQGFADALWHGLLEALSRCDRDAIARAAHRAVAVGATSGVAMLRGFVCGFDVIRRVL